MNLCGARNADGLAISLDCITDALVLAGQHGVYCQSARQAGKPAMDIQLITKSLADAKELISSVLEMKAINKLLKILKKRVELLFVTDCGEIAMAGNHDGFVG